MSEENQEKAKVSAPKTETSTANTTGKIAIILLRGRIGIHRDVLRTLDLLRLQKKHVCVVIDEKENTHGMLQKVKDYVTWGTIDDTTYKLLVQKRGEKDEEGNIKPFFRLNPPKGGFERKGTKIPFTLGGALGNRKEAINTLIVKML